MLIIISLCLVANYGFAETDWSNYDWESEKEVLGPDLNPKYVAVDIKGVEKCRDNILMIFHDLWNGVCGDLKNYSGHNSDRERLLISSMNQRLAELRKKFSCPKGGHFLAIIDRRGAVRVACSVHDLHLPTSSAGTIYGNKNLDIDAFMATRDDWPEQVRFPQFDLDGNYWIQKKETPSRMKVDVHFIDMGATSIVGNKSRANDAHEKGMHYYPAPPDVNLTDRVIKAAAPDKYYLDLARESMVAGRFPQALRFLAEAYPLAEVESNELCKELLRSAETIKLAMPGRLVFTMKLLDNTGRMNAPSDFSEEIRTCVAKLEARLEELHSEETFLSIRNRLKPLIKHGLFGKILPLPDNHWLIFLEANIAGKFFGGEIGKKHLWLVGQGVNKVLELEWENLHLNRSQVSMLVHFDDAIYLGILPESDYYDSLMKTLRFVNKPGLSVRFLDEQDPKTAEALQILCHRIYRIPLEEIISNENKIGSD